jgi:ribosomal protein S18 acetylase RimI-like enzyme
MKKNLRTKVPMNYTKNVFIVLSSLIFISVCIPVLVIAQDNGSHYAIEWYEITPQNFQTMLTIFDQLKPVFIESYVPLTKLFMNVSNDGAALISKENKLFIEQKVLDPIVEFLNDNWRERITILSQEIQHGNLLRYLAIARDSDKTILGFTMFTKISSNRYLDEHTAHIIEGSHETSSLSYDHDEVYVSPLAVRPTAQKRGVGKALLFSVFNHCPSIKKIFLTTPASPLNKNAKDFYEHIGFTRIFTGIFPEHKNPVCRDGEMFYLYKKNEAFNL